MKSPHGAGSGWGWGCGQTSMSYCGSSGAGPVIWPSTMKALLPTATSMPRDAVAQLDGAGAAGGVDRRDGADGADTAGQQADEFLPRVDGGHFSSCDWQVAPALQGGCNLPVNGGARGARSG